MPTLTGVNEQPKPKPQEESIMSRTPSIPFDVEKDLKGTKVELSDQQAASARIYMTWETMDAEGKPTTQTSECREYINALQLRFDSKGNVVGVKVKLNPSVTMVGSSVRVMGGHVPPKLPFFQTAVKDFIGKLQEVVSSFSND